MRPARSSVMRAPLIPLMLTMRPGIGSARELPSAAADLIALACTPDGAMIAAAGADGAIMLWDAGGGHSRARLEGHAKAARCVAFSPGGRTLASASDGDPAIWFWDADRSRPVATLALPDAALVEGFSCLAFAPDGKTLYTGGTRGLAAWDVSPGSKVLRPTAAKGR
jgi:WD40 repeat protein